MIGVSGLHFTYAGNPQPTIKGIEFTLKKGELLGFLGPSGAGKSTLQKIIIGILKDYQGSVQVEGVELGSRQLADYYERIGVAFEVPNLYSKFTALENLRFFGALYANAAGHRQEPERLLSEVGLKDAAHTRVANFSKGMRVRLNFCRAFLHNPDIIFLDEPTAGLDPVNIQRIKRLILSEKAKGKTILLTTHNMHLADELCDRVAFILDGGIKLLDNPRQLKLSRGKKTVRVEYRQGQEERAQEFPLVGIGHNRDYIQLLQEMEIQTIHTLEASLEDIFIEVTGRSLL